MLSKGYPEFYRYTTKCEIGSMLKNIYDSDGEMGRFETLIW
jgi:hypothetical protein